MKPQVFLRSVALVLAVCWGLSLGACGYKTAPVPPKEIVPETVKDLNCQLGKDGATLTWTYPQKTVKGKKLQRISKFKLYRAVVPTESYCKSCPIPFQSPIELDGGTLPDKGHRTGTYTEKQLRPGNLYFYKIRSNNGVLSESEDSNLLSFLWETPAAAPADLEGHSEGNGIQLRWSAVSKNQNGSALTQPVRYQIFRRTGTAEAVKLGEAISATSFRDSKVQKGQSYVYQVQAISVFEQGLVPGGMSKSVSVTPVDRDAPPKPEPPQVVVTDRGTQVFWNHVDDEDLFGYRIYRRVAGQGAAKLVGQVDLPFNMYIDRNPPKGTVYYAISSVDGENPPNESTRTAEVRAEEEYE